MLKKINRENPRRETTSMPINFPVMPVSRHFWRKHPKSEFDEQVMPNRENFLFVGVFVAGRDIGHSSVEGK
jgi:hypothetical protein